MPVLINQESQEERLKRDAAQAAMEGNVGKILNVIGRAKDINEQTMVVNTLIHNMGEPGKKNIDEFMKTVLENNKNITNTNAKELVMISVVMFGAQLKGQSDFTISTSELKRIMENPDLTPEIRAIAGQTKDGVEYEKFMWLERINKIFEEIKKLKRAESEGQYSFKSA